MTGTKMQIETVAKERGLIFTGESVRGILEGRKTQTRRLLKFPAHTSYPDGNTDWVNAVCEDGGGNWIAWSANGKGVAEFTKKAYPNGEGFKCPLGKVGDRIWVRETWDKVDDPAEPPPFVIDYAANSPNRIMDKLSKGSTNARRWKSPMFMPRYASRLTLEITAIRAERLQSITREDVIAEGIQVPVTTNGCPPGKAHPMLRFGKYSTVDYLPANPTEDDYYRAEFAARWDEINGKRATWEINPWVFVLSFRVCK